MTEPLYKDIKESGDDIALDAGGNPEMVYDRDCIAQDLVHMVRDSGLLELQVGNRNKPQRDVTLNKVSMFIEEDERVVPGTVVIEESHLGEYFIVCESVDFGPIEFMASTGAK